MPLNRRIEIGIGVGICQAALGGGALGALPPVNTPNGVQVRDA